MILFHADDYGLSEHVSQEIHDLAAEGYLDGVSVIINMKHSVPALQSLLSIHSANSKLKICLHLNFMEGHCCADASRIPLLVNSSGYFSLSWEKLFAVSFFPGLRKKYRQQLQMEISAQIHHFLNAMPDSYVLRIDSHQHTHVIPVVWDALMDVLSSESLACEFIRLPAEPLMPFFKLPTLYSSYGLTSWIKNLILNMCSLRASFQNPKSVPHFFALWGIMTGCHMDVERVSSLFPFFQKYGRGNRTLCLLFHPGQVLYSEITPEYNNPAFLEVETSENRRMERDTLISLHDIILSSLQKT